MYISEVFLSLLSIKHRVWCGGVFKRNWLVLVVFENGEYIDGKIIYVKKESKRNAIQIATELLMEGKLEGVEPVEPERVLQIKPVRAAF